MIVPVRLLSLSAMLLATLCVLGSCAVDKADLAKRVDLRSPDLHSVSDGTYEAAYTIESPVMAANKSVRVRVTVAGGRYAGMRSSSLPGSAKANPTRN